MSPARLDHRSSESGGGKDRALTRAPTSTVDTARAPLGRGSTYNEWVPGTNLAVAPLEPNTSRAAFEPNTSRAALEPFVTSSERCAGPECKRTERVALSSDPYAKLPEVTFFDRNSKQSLHCRLYTDGGVIDEDSALRLDLHLADKRDPKLPRVGRLDRRLLQLLFRVAYHFEADTIEVVSAYREQGSRRRREGLHGLARAIDFAVPGVKTEALASYLRQQARVGVGIYTHRRTRFVHLDVRDESYHWLDASPPRRTWRGVSIGNKTLPQRDAAYDARNDWPEGLPTPTECRVR
ncbi:MAG TPA: DUF882 domain-containing protein [Polyangiaceae bacterium]|nr:DUF882 domain-containing protein [Polyangiaceae bacterium]